VTGVQTCALPISVTVNVVCPAVAVKVSILLELVPANPDVPAVPEVPLVPLVPLVPVVPEVIFPTEVTKPLVAIRTPFKSLILKSPVIIDCIAIKVKF
jgi:hypothetical protein